MRFQDYVHHQGPLRQSLTACCTPRVRASTSQRERCVWPRSVPRDRGVCLQSAHTDTLGTQNGKKGMYNTGRNLRSIEGAIGWRVVDVQVKFHNGNFGAQPFGFGTLFYVEQRVLRL